VLGHVDSQYGPEYIVLIDGKQYRAIAPDHIRAIQTSEAHSAALEKENALEADEIASLKRQTALEAKLDALNTQILSLKDDQLAQFRLLTKGQSDAIDKLNAIRGEQPTKSILDKLWVKGLIAGAGFASNVKSLYVSEPTPCVVAPMATPPKSAFSFKLTIRK
jgi:hypothetical protein